MVASTSHLDPIDAFAKLLQQQNLQQQPQEPTKLLKWFMPNTYKYFVLLHDVTEGDESKYVQTNRILLHRTKREHTGWVINNTARRNSNIPLICRPMELKFLPAIEAYLKFSSFFLFHTRKINQYSF